MLPAYDEQTIHVSAREKAESFASIKSKLGVMQKAALTEAIRAGYAKRAGSPTPYPDFQDILEIAAAAYEEDGKKDDSLIEVLRDLSDFDLFWKHGSDAPPIEKLASRSMRIWLDLILKQALQKVVDWGAVSTRTIISLPWNAAPSRTLKSSSCCNRP